MTPKIPRDQAQLEVDSWLEKKKVFDGTKEKFKDQVEIMVEAIMNGVLVYDQEKSLFNHKLLFPEEPAVDTLTYKLRLNDKQIAPHMKGVKSDNADERVNALLAALTNTSRSVIASLDSADKTIATAIGVFFM